MRELFLVPDESTSTSLVLRTVDGDQFFLDVTQLDAAGQNLLSGREPGIAAPPGPEPEPLPEPAPVVVAEPPRALPERDPLLTSPLTMRPREIQGRIRGGSSVEELAAEMRVAVSRVEAFAHPVLLERSRMAEMAKQAHPIREDGPAKLTLWEVLAAAFAARGHSVADTSWDAYREADGTWVARVTWTVGLSENEAEWSISAHPTSQTTAEARNPVAADLTDPDFVQPVRSLTSVGRGNRYEEDHDEDTSDGEQLPPEAPVTEELEGEDFQTEEKAPTARRRRKAVTPHWEDVLLGVRANTKRPRN
ncbi:DUF3071 domain-containing protein [Corynebacterium hylobatis]|uniref:DUF3071 domain-containing protein n=1 Tax=Corynebacterium hylobatis TaxID=1859290 RepID=A0A430HVE5_9CORY|nr:septation protein SepH [Corynebacterium hylobatis]RSZ61471.1 DUF3071 domain-containing protein [Corynebacterium hylobatis]